MGSVQHRRARVIRHHTVNLTRGLCRRASLFRQSKFGPQRVSMSGIALNQTQLNQMLKTGRKGGPPRPGRRQQRRLPSRHPTMERRKDRQGPRPRAELDKKNYVHKV